MMQRDVHWEIRRVGAGGFRKKNFRVSWRLGNQVRAWFGDLDAVTRGVLHDTIWIELRA